MTSILWIHCIQPIHCISNKHSFKASMQTQIFYGSTPSFQINFKDIFHSTNLSLNIAKISLSIRNNYQVSTTFNQHLKKKKKPNFQTFRFKTTVIITNNIHKFIHKFIIQIMQCWKANQHTFINRITVNFINNKTVINQSFGLLKLL